VLPTFNTIRPTIIRIDNLNFLELNFHISVGFMYLIALDYSGRS